MIEVKRLADGLSSKVIHESGHESEEEPQVIELDATSEVLHWIEELELKSSVSQHDMRDKQFPIVEEVDLRRLPEQYRLVPAEVPEGFEFTAGETFHRHRDLTDRMHRTHSKRS